MEERILDLLGLNEFIVEAKSRTYVGGGETAPSCRRGSHDIGHVSGKWRYLDSYFGGIDFAGQEVVWLDEMPIWAMNYFGRIVDPSLTDALGAGSLIEAALARLYRSEKRFLGAFDFEHPLGRYMDRNQGGCDHFTGREIIEVRERLAYELDYRGGLVKA
jgi:hypothetical protein